MSIFRMSLYFRSIDDEGWSETHYWDGTNLTSAQTAMDSLISQRAALMVADFKIIYARVSDVTIRGDLLATSLALPVDGTYTPPSGAVKLEANVAIVQKLLATAPYFARIYVRGLTSANIDGREQTAEATFDANYAIYQATLIAGSFQARHRLTPPPGATYNYHPITTAGGRIVSARKPGRPFGLLRGRR